MGDMRVHELAKEFGMENKEFLARLIDMKIPVKSHSSTLNDAFVARIRKQLEPELAEQAAAAEAERQAEAERKAVEERLQKEAIEAERRKAVKEERARRAKERAEKAELSAEPGPAGYDFLAEPVIEPFAGLADEALDDLLAPTPELASANGVLSAEPATAAALAGSTTEAVGTIDTQEAAEPVAVEAEVEPA
ncbi:MAG: translation initiation factor IF-2 N-terminal domain-containing protein, partial [Coriobacteriia bacterium]|nr:translation initiation factor IF-2 N-terminal domain-containing protein [Coriobacteriia bacterium]